MSSLITFICILIISIFVYSYISMYNLNKCKIKNNYISIQNNRNKDILKLIEAKNKRKLIKYPKIFNSNTNDLLLNSGNLYF